MQFFSPTKMQSICENLMVSEVVKKNEQAHKRNAKLQHTILKEQKEADIIQQRMEPSILQRVAKSHFQSPARVPTDPLPEGYDDIAISTGLMTAYSLNLPPPKISHSR
ncbi:hypothetical protein PABG_12628 [Paracoccidioides brasiliensis Pb03]|nr:hypothetical protein PABG_12628 [Paracoccidioides brasiliensis Pb03]